MSYDYKRPIKEIFFSASVNASKNWMNTASDLRIVAVLLPRAADWGGVEGRADRQAQRGHHARAGVRVPARALHAQVLDRLFAHRRGDTADGFVISDKNGRRPAECSAGRRFSVLGAHVVCALLCVSSFVMAKPRNSTTPTICTGASGSPSSSTDTSTDTMGSI